MRDWTDEHFPDLGAVLVRDLEWVSGELEDPQVVPQRLQRGVLRRV